MDATRHKRTDVVTAYFRESGSSGDFVEFEAYSDDARIIVMTSTFMGKIYGEVPLSEQPGVADKSS